MKPMLFPVESHAGGSYHPTPRTVAMFFDSSSAIDFINADERTLFLGEPRYDRRTSGYRPQERDWRAEYEDWSAQFTEVHGDPMLKRRVA